MAVTISLKLPQVDLAVEDKQEEERKETIDEEVAVGEVKLGWRKIDFVCSKNYYLDIDRVEA